MRGGKEASSLRGCQAFPSRNAATGVSHQESSHLMQMLVCSDCQYKLRGEVGGCSEDHGVPEEEDWNTFRFATHQIGTTERREALFCT